MDNVVFHHEIARVYNLTRKPVFEKFVQAYDGEIKYVFSRDYIVEIVDRDGFRIGIHCGVSLSSWGSR